MAGHDMEKFAKLSTRLWQNEKVRVFAMEHPSAFSVWTFAISYCAGELNDGELSRFHLKCLLGASDEDIDALIDAHLLDEHEDGTLWLHDFVAAQGRSRADVEEAKAKKAEAGRKGGAASGKSRNVKQDSSKTKQTRSTNEADVKQDSSKTKPDTDTDTDTDTDKNSSNEEFSLPQTPSQAEGAGEEDSWSEDNLKANLGEEPRAISYEQAKAIVEQVRGFYPASKMRGRSYERTLVLESAPIVKAAGAAPDIVAWFVNRCREYVARQSEPRYVTDFGIYVAGGGKADKRPYWEVDWANEPMPKSPEEEKAEAEHERRLRDVDWLCSHVDDEECQRATLALSEKQQALARSKWPDEWYRLWRRAENLRDREERERMEAGA